MKNKEKKFKSLKSVFILLQQLQTKYYNQLAIHLDIYESGSIDVYIGMPNDGLFEFSAVDDSSVWKATYKELLKFLKQLDYEE